MENPAPILTHDNVLTQDEITSILNDSVAQSAFKRLELGGKQQEYFTMELSDEIKRRLGVLFGMDFSSIQRIPMRWIKGNVAAHEDKGINKDFKKTHLLYVSECSGDFVIDGRELSIQQNRAFVFDEGLIHETRNTNDTPRLLVGPMDENGNAVGGITSISLDGATHELHISYSGGAFAFSTNPPDISLSISSWPITIENSNSTPSASSVLRVIFDSDITITSRSQYFICESEYIQFGNESINSDGSRPNITIEDVSNYPGLIQNGTSTTDGYGDINIFNLRVLSTGSTTLVDSGGWVCQRYYGNNASSSITNCFSDGTISANGGGIVGANAGRGFSLLSIRNCNTTGQISSNGGGIIGRYAGQNSSVAILIAFCSSSGLINSSAGGICGSNSSDGVTPTDSDYASSSKLRVNNCYSTGNISASAGGIYGVSAYAQANTCYSLGNIAANGGGIFGANPVNAVASTCYTTGNVTAGGGGIFGEVGEDLIARATRCYTCGTIPSSDFEIFGTLDADADAIQSLSEHTEGWNKTIASSTLVGAPSGSSKLGNTWAEPTSNEPFELYTIKQSPFRLDNIDFDNTLNHTETHSMSLILGDKSSPPFFGSNFSIMSIDGQPPTARSPISINSSTGEFSVLRTAQTKTYDVVIRCISNPYVYSNVLLTITPDFNCCISLNGMKYLPAEDVTTVRAGNHIVSVALTNPKNKFTSYDAYLRYKATGMSKKRL